MPSRDILDLCDDLKPLCRDFIAQCDKAGITVILTTTYRSNMEQDALYCQGRSAPGKIVTKARGGQSKHNYVLAKKPDSHAFDFAIAKQYKSPSAGLNWDTKHADWKKAIEIGEKIGLVSGSRWKFADYAHMELLSPTVPTS